jgi:hypothetical protein
MISEGDADMEKTLEGTSHLTGLAATDYLMKGLGWGILGGLTGTLGMDLLLIAALLVVGQPAVLCFSIVGDTISCIFAVLGAQIAGGVATGVVTHYVIGPVIGAIFGLVVTRVKALRVYSLKKSILLGILYVEILSQPLLATAPILLKMTAPAALLWYDVAFVMHLIAGGILGAVVGRCLRLVTAINHR